MTFEAIAAWVAANPWISSLIAVLCLVIMFKIAKTKASKRKFQILRSTKDQAKFSPVQTTYNPRQYRKKR